MSDKIVKADGQSNPTIFDLFSRPLADFDFLGRRAEHASLTMSTDLIDKGDHYDLITDLPGVAKEDIHLSFKDGLLSISAERKFEKSSDDANGYLMHERFAGSCSRDFSFDDVDPEGISASFNQGQLCVSLKKQQRTQGREISIS